MLWPVDVAKLSYRRRGSSDRRPKIPDQAVVRDQENAGSPTSLNLLAGGETGWPRFSAKLVVLTGTVVRSWSSGLCLLGVLVSGLLAAFAPSTVAGTIPVVLIPATSSGLAGLVLSGMRYHRNLHLTSSRTHAMRIAAVKQAREQLARELHDDILQMLGAARLRLATRSFAGHNDTSHADRPRNEDAGDDELIEMLDDIIRSTRALIHQLRGASDAAGFEKSTRSLCRSISAAYGINIRLHVDVAASVPDDVGQIARTSALRIIQEALSNAARHSGGNHVRVKVVQRRDFLVVKVADDGKGFDPSAPSLGMGLRNMRERAEELGGTFTIGSSQVPPSGTWIKAVLPVTPWFPQNDCPDDIGTFQSPRPAPAAAAEHRVGSPSPA